MAIPPSYGDLGKAARDLFCKGFNYGFYKLEVKTKTDAGVDFTIGGSSNHETSKVTGNLETKYKLSSYGLTFCEKWNTDNNLNTEVTIEDQFLKGLKLSFDTSFSPVTGRKSGKIKTAYKREYVNIDADVDMDVAGPIINTGLVAGYKGWLAGYQMSFNTREAKFTRNNFAIGYEHRDFTLHTNVNSGTEFGGSIFHKLRHDLECGVMLSWTAGNNVSKLGVAAKYTPDKDTTIRARINNASQIGLSYQQKIRSGVSLTLSALLEGKNFNQGGHKIGIGLDFEA